jgi:ribosomal protein S27E
MIIKKCNSCGQSLEKIIFTHKLSEEWAWNGKQWECIGRNSLIHDPHLKIRCPECDAVIGTGKDFGFN